MATMNINGVDYRIKRNARYGRYVEVPVELLTPGMNLDQGGYVRHAETMFNGAVNPNTWEVYLDNGYSYIETRGASVRVWVK